MPYLPIADAAAVLQVAVTRTASANSTALDQGVGYAPDSLGVPVAGVIFVTALTGTGTYAFTLQESADGTTGWADIGFPVNATAIGQIFAKGLTTKRFIRLVLTTGGTNPSIAYTANAGA